MTMAFARWASNHASTNWLEVGTALELGYLISLIDGFEFLLGVPALLP
jgi:hypothetical protein